MTPEEYQEHLDNLKAQHEELAGEMFPEGEAEQSPAGQITEPPAPTQSTDAPDERQDASEGYEAQIPEPPPALAVGPQEASGGLPDREGPEIEIPEPPAAEQPAAIQAFVANQKQQWREADPSRIETPPPPLDTREDSGMARPGDLRADMDDFAVRVQQSYQSAQNMFASLADLSGSHGFNIEDILARLQRARLP